MAKPPDGASAWFKHADLWQLLDGEQLFASVTATVDGASASITMPFVESPYEAFFVVRFAVTGADPVVQLGDDARQLPWADGLLPAAVSLYPRRRVRGVVPGAPALATLVQQPGGALAVIDAAGRQRVVAHRDCAGMPAAGAARLSACGGRMCFDVPSYPGTRVHRADSSLP